MSLDAERPVAATCPECGSVDECALDCPAAHYGAKSTAQRRYERRFWRRRLGWWWTCRIRRKYPMEVYRTINPCPPPTAAIERLRKRVLSGDWESPDA